MGTVLVVTIVECEENLKMIPRNKLKFDETDLKFFDKQRDIKEIKLTKLHYFILNHIKHNGRISAAKLAKLANINGADVRKIILDFRRYTEPKGYFITANNEGYTKSCFNKCCKEELIAYFDKTQTRFKETFNELVNLMKCLNEVDDGEKQKTM